MLKLVNFKAMGRYALPDACLRVRGIVIDPNPSTVMLGTVAVPVTQRAVVSFDIYENAAERTAELSGTDGAGPLQGESREVVFADYAAAEDGVHAASTLLTDYFGVALTQGTAMLAPRACAYRGLLVHPDTAVLLAGSTEA